MKNLADCVDEVRRRKGFRSDREVGELFDCSQQLIAQARSGGCTDPIAVKLAEVIGEDPGRLLLMARAERERDPTIRAHLIAYAKKALAAVPSKAASVVATFALALAAWFLPAPDAQAGGAGGNRT